MNMLTFDSTTNKAFLPNHLEVVPERVVRRSRAREQRLLEQFDELALLSQHHKKHASPRKKIKPKSSSVPRDTKDKSSQPHPLEICLPALNIYTDDASPKTNKPHNREEQNPIPDKVPSPEVTLPNPDKRPRCPRNTIDIGNGVSVPFVGLKETLSALHQDKCANTTCIDCTTFLYHVDAASLVLCPECRSIGLVTASSDRASSDEPSLVGLGLTVEHVVAEYQRGDLE